MLDRYIGECMGMNNQHQLMVSKNLPMGIDIVIQVKHRYLVGMSR